MYRVVNAPIWYKTESGLEKYQPGDEFDAPAEMVEAFGDNLEKVETEETEDNEELPSEPVDETEEVNAEIENDNSEEICGTVMSDGSECTRLKSECGYHESN